MGEQRLLDKVTNIAMRGAIRVATRPFCGLPESGTKQAIRRAVLSLQNSLPLDLAVNPGDTVIQVGTPWPRTMHRFVQRITPSGHLVIVEAMPENQERLARAIKDEQLRNVSLVRAAAFNRTGEGTLATSPHAGDHRVSHDGIRIDNDLRDGNAQMDEIAVRFVRLDDALAELGLERFDFLSVTVNGAEATVLEGASGLLEAARPGARVYAKGHAVDADGHPVRNRVRALLEDAGFRTKATRGEPSWAAAGAPRRRAGDVYAWKV